MGQNKEKKLLENTVFIYLMRIASYIFPLITTPYLTRVLMENNYGIYAWANAIINYARLFVDYGFVIYGVEAIAECQGDNKSIRKVVGQIIEFKIIFSIITGIILFILCAVVEKFSEHAVLIMISYIPVIISIFGIDYVFQGMEQMKYITVRVVVTKAIFTILVFLLVNHKDQYVLVPVLTAIGDLLSVIFMWVSAKKLEIGISFSKLHDGWILLKKSTWYFLSRVFGAIFSYGNLIFIGFFLAKAEVAQYSVAYTLIVVAQNFITPIADSLYPYMVKNKNYAMVKRIFLIFEPLIIIACAIGFVIVKPVVMWWFGSEYIIAAKVVRYMIPIIIIALPGCLFGFPTLSAMGLYKETNIAVIVAAVFHVCGWLLLALTNNISIYNIAILTCCTEFVVVLIRTYFVLNTLGKNRWRLRGN